MRDTAPGQRPGVIVAVLAFAGIVASLMQTVLVPFIGELPRLLHTSASNTTWAITITLLVGAVATPVAGRLGDLYGKKPLLLASVVPLVAGSVVCALAHSLTPMIIGRGLQGLGVGIVPLGISTLRDVLPREKLGSAIALISASLGIGGALGLPISAAVGEHASFNVLFWGAAALTAVVGVLIWALIPGVPRQARGRFDSAGAIGLGAGVVCLLLGISKGADWGWGSGTIIGLLVSAVVILVAWGLFELRHSDPLVDLRTTARRQVLFTNIASVVVGFAMYVQLLVVMQILQLPVRLGYGLGQSMLAAGLWMAPSGLMMMLVSPLSARLSAVHGPKVTLALGSLIMAAGYLALVALMGSTWGVLACSCVVTAGCGFAYGAMPALIMGAVPQSETAAANSFNTLMRSLGTSTSAAVIGVVLSQMTVTLGGTSLPSESGFHAVLLIAGLVAAAAAATTLLIPGRHTSASLDPAPEPVEVLA